jgi:Domain of unknown function (DUF4331)
MKVISSKTPNRLGVVGGDISGFPNGRRLTDDVIDITIQAAEGILLPNPAAGVSTATATASTPTRSTRSSRTSRGRTRTASTPLPDRG